MKLRIAQHVVVGTLVALALVFFASSLAAGPGSGLAAMATAQRAMPLLWIVDVCALGLIAGMWWVAVVSNHFQTFADHQAAQHFEQLNDMIERTLDLEQAND